MRNLALLYAKVYLLEGFPSNEEGNSPDNLGFFRLRGENIILPLHQRNK